MSGIRASHDRVTPDLFAWATQAFVDVLRQGAGDTAEENGKKALTIVLGRDSRVSGEWAQRVVEGTLCAAGVTCISVGIVPTPTVQLLVQLLKADGGIVLTASHNPIAYNGLKFIGADGLFLRPDLAKRVNLASTQQPAWKATLYPGRVKVMETNDVLDQHIGVILSLPYICPDDIVKAHFKVVIDSVNGAGGPIMVKLLEQLGCTVIPLNTEPTGRFAHKPEPLPAHLGDLCAAVKTHGADVGMAVDPDSDRFVAVDEHGSFIGEEYSLVTAVYTVLKHVLPRLSDEKRAGRAQICRQEHVHDSCCR